MRILFIRPNEHSGGGEFAYSIASGLTLSLKGSPICRLLRTHEPACAYFAAISSGCLEK